MVETMAARLKQLKEREKKSYEAFGAIAGVSAQAVQKWMVGGDVKEANLSKLGRYFKVTPMWIRYGVDVAQQADAAGIISPLARDIANRWMALSDDRQEWFRDLIFTTHWIERRFPTMRKGRPRGEHYAAFEAGVEREMKQLKLFEAK